MPRQGIFCGGPANSSEHVFPAGLNVLVPERLLCQLLADPEGAKFARPRAYRDVWTRIRPIPKGAWPPGRRIAAEALSEVAGGGVYTGYE